MEGRGKIFIISVQNEDELCLFSLSIFLQVIREKGQPQSSHFLGAENSRMLSADTYRH